MRITFYLIFTFLGFTGCTVKWAEKIADKGFSFNECIGHYDKAMKVYNRGIFFNKKCPTLYWRRGCLNARNNNHSKAIEDFNKSIILDSIFNGGYAYFDRAISNEALNNISGALKDYDKSIEIDPKKENFYFFRGVLKYKVKDYDGAMMDFDTAIRLWDKFNLARLWRSSLKVEIKDYQGAMDDYDNMTFSKNDETNPDRAWQFRYRGIAKYETLDSVGACNDWKIAANHKDSIAIELIKKNVNRKCP